METTPRSDEEMERDEPEEEPDQEARDDFNQEARRQFFERHLKNID